MFFTKSKLFKKWLLTYLFLIAVSLAFIFSVNFLYERSIRDGLYRLNRSYLDQVAHIFDDDFTAIDRLVYTLAQDSRIVNLLNMKGNLTANDRYEIRTVVKDLEIYSTANRLIDSISLYSANPDFLVDRTGVYYGDYIDLYSTDKLTLSLPALRKLMAGPGADGFSE